MRRTFIVTTMLLALAGCSQTEQGAVIGGVSGAAIGTAVAARGNRAEGALVGGAIGTVAGALIGRANERDQCYYRDDFGRRRVARCPSGYRW